MISMLRKEACSGSIDDLAHVPTQNCLGDCLTKASAKADNLITAAKTGKLLYAYIHPDFRTTMEHKAFLTTWCRSFMYTREKEVFFLNDVKISLAPESQEGPFPVNFAVTQFPRKHRELNTRECKVATNITFALADSCIQIPWSVIPILVMLIVCVCFLQTFSRVSSPPLEALQPWHSRNPWHTQNRFRQDHDGLGRMTGLHSMTIRLSKIIIMRPLHYLHLSKAPWSSMKRP